MAEPTFKTAAASVAALIAERDELERKVAGISDIVQLMRLDTNCLKDHGCYLKATEALTRILEGSDDN